jgi:hypothetical protein
MNDLLPGSFVTFSKMEVKDDFIPKSFVTGISMQAYHENLLKENVELKEKMKNMVAMNLSYQWYIPVSPLTKTQLYGQACTNDTITVQTWLKMWLDHIEKNAKYGYKENSVMQEYAKQAMKPVIIAGSGPSLKRNAHWLLEKKDICLVSCLHNFAYFNDLGIHPDYYINLDAGDITISELSQGGTKTDEYYWEQTKNYTLVTAMHCHPSLHERWLGKKLWYATCIPDPEGQQKAMALSDNFDVYFQCGGNALGSCLYMARAILGGCPIAFIGADFCFSYEKKFHPFKSPYDEKFSGVVPATDVFGNRVYTWQSYYNFKNWFDFQAMGGIGSNPQFFINCTEGGLLGAYQDGNIIQIIQMPLEYFVKMYTMYTNLPKVIENKMLLF